jgi:glycosyltransferase involved in cell wall biosynthesis
MVLHSMGIAGMERVVARLATTLRARGHSVGITCTDLEGALAPGLRDQGIRVTHVPAPGRSTLVRPVALRRWFEEISPDIVHIHNVPWLKAALAARQARVPGVLFTLHGRNAAQKRMGLLLDRCAVRLCDRITAVSTPLHQHVTERLHAPPQRVLTIPNGIDLEEFSPSRARGRVRAQLGLRDDQPLVGMVARLEPVKNHACLLRAFAKVSGEVPSARLLLVGDGQLRGDIERRIAECGLGESVIMMGERADVADVYRDLDVHVLSSFAEGASISLLEAMASEVCNVASDVGGTPELLDGGSCGLLVSAGDADALARGIIEVLRDSERRRGLARAARRRCLEHYGFAKAIDRYERIYAEMLSGEATRAGSERPDAG